MGFSIKDLDPSRAVKGIANWAEDNPLTAIGALAAPVTGGASLFFGTMIDQQIKGQKLAEEQANESKKQASIRSSIAGLRAQRERSEMIRRARIARAQVESQGASTGTQQSSIVTGGVSGLTSTVAGNIGFSQVSSDAGQKIFQSGQRIYDLEKRKGRADLAAGVSNTLFNLSLRAPKGAL